MYYDLAHIHIYVCATKILTDLKKENEREKIKLKIKEQSYAIKSNLFKINKKRLFFTERLYNKLLLSMVQTYCVLCNC